MDVADPSDTNPECRLIKAFGWKILLLHIVGLPPNTNPDAAKLIQQHRPDIVVFGHSHKACVAEHDGILYLNPGSAGMLRLTLALILQGDACGIGACALGFIVGDALLACSAAPMPITIQTEQGDLAVPALMIWSIISSNHLLHGELGTSQAYCVSNAMVASSA